jgi:hypothetical protein
MACSAGLFQLKTKVNIMEHARTGGWFDIIETPDSRNTLIDSDGVYSVYKKNRLTEFRFGKGHQYPDCKTAHKALQQWLNDRKDANKLTVHLLQIGVNH